jgi:aconitate hydratase
MELTGRNREDIALVEAYAKEQGLWRDENTLEPEFTSKLELDISTIVPAISGPKRPQDRIDLTESSPAFETALKMLAGVDAPRSASVEGANYSLDDGHVVIASITSCTNTSNPAVLIAAGLLARNAVAKGLTSKPWVKTSLAPGSQVVADYLEKADLQSDLDALGFNIVAFGCTTCIGNSGPLARPIASAIEEEDLTVTAVLSGNRNFEGRISPHVKANYLASPPLVVAYAIAGSMTKDLYNEPLGQDQEGNEVYLKDIWPSNKEVGDTMLASLTRDMFESRYGNVYEGPKEWQDIPKSGGTIYDWPENSTYVKNPPYFENMGPEPNVAADVTGARPLMILGDSITTDHISPAGPIKKDSPAGEYLLEYQVRPEDFNSYGARRGNHEIMMRGTFANIRIKNEMVPGTEGGFSKHYPSGDDGSVFDVAMRYKEEGSPLVVFGGKEYGTGSSRDWAAKGSALLGVRAVITESFERIHRANLVFMGVLPLVFKDGVTRKSLKLDGSEVIDLTGIKGGITPRMDVQCKITRTDGSSVEAALLCRIDTLNEVEYYLHGGILQYVLRKMMKEAT